MPLGTGNITQANANTAGFVPEVWSDEIIAAYKKNLVAANLFKKMNMKGRKGDVVHFPVAGRGSASSKTASSQVTLIGESSTEKTVTINNHFEYSRLIEDFAEVQALSSLRRFYTDDAGYSLARQIDTTLVRLGRATNNANVGTNDYATSAASTNAFIGSNGSTVYNSSSSNAAALTDEGIRRAIQRLDDGDIPMDGRFLIVPPSTRNTMMGIARFTEQAFVGDVGGANTIRNGLIGDIYGVKVYVTTNADSAAGNAGADRVCLLAHPDYAVLVEQLGVRVQTQYKQEYLGTLLTADTLYGAGALRTAAADSAAVALVVPA
jgi:N4-gp56 family major capsid protein